jgi:hypothetical protein
MSSGQMSSGQMYSWANVFMGKCLYGQMLSGQMSPWANVEWANVSEQMSLGKYRMGKRHGTLFPSLRKEQISWKKVSSDNLFFRCTGKKLLFCFLFHSSLSVCSVRLSLTLSAV